MKKWIALTVLCLGGVGLLIYSHHMHKSGQERGHSEVPSVTERTLGSISLSQEGESLDPISPNVPFAESFLAAYPGDWSFHKTHQGRVFRVLGGTIKGVGESQESIESLATSLARWSHATGSSFKYAREMQTNLSVTYLVEQLFAGFRVYGAWARFTANKRGDVSLVEMSFKDVEADLNTEVLVPQGRAQEIVEEEFPEVEGVSVEALTTTPEVWTEDEAEQELVWEFMVSRQQPSSVAYRVVVGAHTGRVRGQFQLSND